MKIKKPIYISSIIGFLCVLNACTEPFDINTRDAESVIVVYGQFTDQLKHHTITLSSSGYIGQQHNISLSGANITITSSENDVILFQEVDTIPGRYMTVEEVAGKVGLTYVLNVDVDIDGDGIQDSYRITSLMLPSIEIDSAVVRKSTIMGYTGYMLYLYAQDPPSRDYYLTGYQINDSVIFSQISDLSPVSDEMFNGQYMDNRSWHMFVDAEEHPESNYPKLKPGDILSFDLSRIEKGYYNFIIQAQTEMNGEIPIFGAPAANIATNIPGGVGYFSAFAVNSYSVTVK